MKPIVAMVVALALAGPVQAAECRLAAAEYTQQGSNWTLRFAPVPRTAAANQVAAFTLGLPNSGEMLEGAVHIPNGYGAAWGTLSLDCPEDAAEEDYEACVVWNDVIYASGAAGLGELPHSDADPAPQQILFPKLASTIWYSLRRDAEWTDEQVPSDVFDFAGCRTAP